MSIPHLSEPLEQMKTVRDLTVIDINETQYMVVACDSDGGIGTKELDLVQVSEDVLGAFAVRVPLFEIIASGATPLLVVDCLSVEMDGTGEKLIRAIKAYAARAGLVADKQFTGSTEDNVPTRQTGIGITVLGVAGKTGFYPGSAQAGQVVACAGIPKSAPQHDVRLDDPDILTIEELLQLRRQPGISDMLPVGSKGILYEANQLAASAGLTFRPKEQVQVAWNQSGGPSTCVLFAASQQTMDALAAVLTVPLEVIGSLHPRD